MSSTSQLLLGIAGHLSTRRKRQLLALSCISLCAAGAELISLGSVLPFLGILINPDSIWNESWVQSISKPLGLVSSDQLLLPAALAFSLAALMAASVRLLNLWLGGCLAAAIGSDLSCEAYRKTLYQPYDAHIQASSSGVINSVTALVNNCMSAISSCLYAFSALATASAIFLGLLVVEPVVSVCLVAGFGLIYLLLGVISRKKFEENSSSIALLGKKRLQSIQEGLGAIRDILLDNVQIVYLNHYRRSDRPQRFLQVFNEFLGSFPKIATESLAMLAIASVATFLVVQKGSGPLALPTLAVFALGSQRLLPCLQQAYSGWANCQSYSADMAGVLDLLNLEVKILPPSSESIDFQYIEFSRVRYSYSSASIVIRGVSLRIDRGQRVGLIGTTGSGKSTFLDLLMGLLTPESGSVLVNGMSLHDPECESLLSDWRSSIAHVPQSIYLADSSIAENIAFGVPREQIDLARVRSAAQQAQISAFIESSQEGYESFVGERGIRLSGGQRQRLGIARALYKHAQVLILDEATSALDNDTEQAVMDAINQLDRNLTVVMIAHRLSTVAKCDRVIRLDHGRVVADGPPSQVLAQA